MDHRFDRRTLMTATAAGALAGLASGSSRPRVKLKKALKYGMIGEGKTPLEKFELVKSLGFQGVEPDSPSGLDVDEVVAAAEQTGIEIPGVVDSVHWGKPFSHPDPKVRAEGVAALETALRDCKRYGGSSVLVVPAVVNAGVSYADAYRRSQEELRKCLPLAEELEIDIAFENVWNNFLLSPLEAARYIDELGDDVCGWFLDVGNVVRFAWPEHWVQALGHRVLKLDVKEYSRKKQNEEGLWKGFQVGIGDGDCGWPQVMAALDEVGFEGWASAEVGGGGRERMEDILARMNRVLDA